MPKRFRPFVHFTLASSLILAAGDVLHYSYLVTISGFAPLAGPAASSGRMPAYANTDKTEFLCTSFRNESAMAPKHGMGAKELTSLAGLLLGSVVGHSLQMVTQPMVSCGRFAI